uniref:Uncharacterized protein n=1 Tax=Pyrodinium bahamense TaxID=73915 RepID=A0A7S0A7X5_9DINO
MAVELPLSGPTEGRAALPATTRFADFTNRRGTWKPSSRPCHAWISCVEPCQQSSAVRIIRPMLLASCLALRARRRRGCVSMSIGRAGFFASVTAGDESSCLRLLKADAADLEERDMHGMTAFHWAAANGLLEVCIAISAKDRTKVTTADYYGRNALHLAAASGHLEVCKTILEHPDFNKVSEEDKDGLTPLRWAAESGHAQICELIFGYADVSERSDKIWTSLHFGLIDPRPPPQELL